jgi:serine/threonine protein kinase
MSLPTGIVTIDEAGLKYGRKLGAGGFADVYCATWSRRLEEEEGEEGEEEGQGERAGEGDRKEREEEECEEGCGEEAVEGWVAAWEREGAGAPHIPPPEAESWPAAPSRPRAASRSGPANRVSFTAEANFTAEATFTAGANVPAGANSTAEASYTAVTAPCDDAAGICCPAHARHPRRPRLCVAVKRLHSAPEDATLMSAFCHEIGLMKRLDHPNVLRLYGVTVSPGEAHGRL